MGRIFTERTPVNEAIGLISKAEIRRVGKEKVEIFRACGRILAEDVIAKWDVPHFDRAAMDGYAVKAEDTFGASPTNPVILRLVGEVEIGERPCGIGKGEAVRVSTGSALPERANAVVMLEHAKEIDGSVEIYRSVTPWENVSKRGEDVREGEVVLRKGEILHPQDVGVLASLGYSEVVVLKRPKVAVIATGNELIEVGKKPEVGKVVNSNSPMLCCAIREMGCEPVYVGIVEDEFEKLRDAVSRALSTDAVIVTGGTSVGKRDLVPDVVKELGELVFHGVSMKPGMPTGFGVIEGKPILLLPGFPVACILAFYTFFPEILAKLTGVRIVAKRGEKVKARLSRRIPSQPGVRTFARVVVRNGIAIPVRTSGSGILTSMVKANGMVVVPEEKEGFEEGELVEVTLIRDLVEVL